MHYFIIWYNTIAMEDGIRINKYLSEMGLCSRREADRLIESGRVQINGNTAVTGQRLIGNETVRVDGRLIGKTEDTGKVKRVILAVNKPRGVVCSMTHADRMVILSDIVNYPERVYPIGRLDKDSEGLILMTNDGELANEITRASGNHEKEYMVTVNKPVSPEFIRKMSGGMYLKELNKSTKPCEVRKTGEMTFNIILTQGLNRQIRRMCEECGYKVLMLKRIRIMNISLGKLKEGTWKRINPEWLN